MADDLLFDVEGHGADDQTQALLRALAGDPKNAADRLRIVRAIVAASRAERGVVDPNRVRGLLAGTDQRLVVNPRLLSATYSALAHTKHLEPHGYVISTDVRGGNSGKLVRRWRLVSLTSEAALRRALTTSSTRETS